MKGVFISFDGIEGTGKSSQAKLLRDYLSRKGMDVVQTEEPGGTDISRRIREILLSRENRAMDCLTELLLYNAARVQHLRELILPALGRGAIVISDRFSDSTVAYQGHGRGIDLALIDSLDLISTGRLRPHLTFLLDLETEEGLRRNRKMNKQDRLELEDVSFHRKVRKGFLDIAAGAPERIKIIDCSPDVGSVHRHIVEIINQFLDNHFAA